jgi:hypothetical protein
MALLHPSVIQAAQKNRNLLHPNMNYILGEQLGNPLNSYSIQTEPEIGQVLMLA